MTTMRSRVQDALTPQPKRAWSQPELARLFGLTTTREKTLLSVTLREMSLRGEICTWYPPDTGGRVLKLYAVQAPPGIAATAVRQPLAPAEKPTPDHKSIWPFNIPRREMRNAPGIWISNPRRSYVPVGPSKRGGDE